MYYLPIHFQCQANNFRYKRMTDGLLGHCKSALSSFDKVQESADSLKSFSEAIVNFHSHYRHFFVPCTGGFRVGSDEPPFQILERSLISPTG